MAAESRAARARALPKTPEDCDRLFAECARAGDVDGLLALYEAGATFVGREGPPATGHAAIREQIAPLLAAKPELRMNVVKTVRAGDDVAVLYNEWTLAMKTPDGQTIEDRGKAIEIVRQQKDGSWRFLLDDPWCRT
jgi:uncharacterized protein (TIGR02246 family)